MVDFVRFDKEKEEIKKFLLSAVSLLQDASSQDDLDFVFSDLEKAKDLLQILQIAIEED